MNATADTAPATRWAGHLWTVLPTVRDLLLRPRPPSQVDAAIPIVDDAYGPTALSCSLAVPDGAEDVVVLVHGLGGNRRSGYVRAAARVLHEAGFATLALDLRGADRRGGGFYHVALTDDLDAACASALLRPFRRVFVFGFSMGGHVAVHFAAKATDPRLAGVVALCTPLDLAAVQRHLDHKHRAVYRHYVLRGLKDIYDAVAARHRVPTPAREVRACRTFHDWDRLTITRRYGYATPERFYADNAAAEVLPDLRVETVMVLAHDDPIVPPWLVLPHLDRAPAGRLHVAWLPRGGHLHWPCGQDLGLRAGHDARPVLQQLAAWCRERRALA